jgi:hypothetical protein
VTEHRGDVGSVQPAAPRRSLRPGALWSDLTAGQRWTSALSVGLAVALAAFGLPQRTIPALGGRAADAASSAPAPARGGSGPLGATSPAGPAPAGIGGSGAVPAGSAGGPPLAGGALPAGSGAAVPNRVVALVRPGSDALPDRDDAAIASVFLAQASLHPTVLAMSADPTLCARVIAAGDVVIASAGLDPPLRDCLAAAGRTVLSYDEWGGPAAGPLVSTRRDVATALVRAGILARAAGAVRGKVGIVASSALRPLVEIGLAGLRAEGVAVASVAYLADDVAPLADVTAGVRQFEAADVTTVVFAASMGQQQAWVAQQAVVRPSARYVVADARDAIVEESYPPLFDGALAVTTTRASWFTRAHGETTAQRACLDQFSPHQQFPLALDARETVTVFAWCQHAALVARALALAAAGTPLADALRRTTVSPLTSDLGTGADGVFAPRQDATLRWRLACRCWSEIRPFQDATA